MKATLLEYSTGGSNVTFRDVAVPRHWTKCRLRFLLRSKISNGLFKKAEFWVDDGTQIVNVGDVYVHDDIVDLEKLGRVECTEAEHKTYHVQHGDIFFVRSSLKLEGIGKPAVVLNPTEPMVFECHLVGGRPDTQKVDPRFLIRFLNSVECRSYLVACAKTATMTTIEQMRIKDLDVLCPPVLEQKQIFAFLDRETAKIDRLMAVRRKQVEHLQEQRTAVIHHAVTKGLDPEAKMKPSGVEWLGDIPESWRMYRLKFTARIKNGQDYKLVESESGYPVMGSGGQFAYANTYLHDGESVLFGRKGTINKPLYMNEKFWTVDTMFYTQIKPVITPKFLYYCAVGFPFEYYSTQTALPSMTQQDIGNHPLAIPALNEQRQIVDYIETETAKLDTLITKYQRELELLAEYRASLISHAVTGKIDVRGLVEPTP